MHMGITRKTPEAKHNSFFYNICDLAIGGFMTYLSVLRNLS